MAKVRLLFANEANAARLLDMGLSEFRALVKDGHLPSGRILAPGVVRWPVDDLQCISAGNAADGLGDVVW